jgi:hypothetical protein
MANRAGEKAYFTFVKGLNTEASPFTFPENSSSDEANFELLINGARRRRLGLDYEAGYVEADTSDRIIYENLQAITQHEWRTAGGSSNKNFVAVQTGRYIRFYNNDTVMSDGLHATYIDLNTFLVSGQTLTDLAITPVSMASGKGYLFIVSKYIEPLYVTYDLLTDAITVQTFLCKTREFTRIEDFLDIAETPATLSDEHRFNLLNQGWTDANITAYKALAASVYPSNTHIMSHGWYGSGTRTFSAAEVNNYERGNTPAPNGHLVTNVFDSTIIYDASNSIAVSSWVYNHGAGTVVITTATAHSLVATDTFIWNDATMWWIGIDGDGEHTIAEDYSGTNTVASSTTYTITINVTPVSSPGLTYDRVDAYSYGTPINVGTLVNPSGAAITYRFEAVGFYAGRVWLAGIDDATLAARIYYSQILTDESKIGLLHQEADPTSEEDSDVVDTDGGYLTIPEMGKVVAMELMGSKLILFTTNGVFSIAGGAEDYFKATSYSIHKIIDLSVTSPRSVVNVDGALISFAKQGIYQYAEDPTSGTILGKSISQDTIQTLFSEIPELCLPHVKGLYDDTYKRVLWAYSIDHTNPKRHSKILILDLRLGAWSLYTIPNSNDILVSGGAVVRTATTKDIKIKLFTINYAGSTITWSDFTNTDWLDFYTYDSIGIDAAAYLITGHELVGDTMRKKQVPYMFTYCKRSETEWVSTGTDSVDLSPKSSCMVQFWWDFSDTTSSNKVGTAFQAYRYNRMYIPSGVGAFDPGYNVITTKNKIRGVGHVFQIKFYTEAGKDLYLYGWNTTFSGYTEV